MREKSEIHFPGQKVPIFYPSERDAKSSLQCLLWKMSAKYFKEDSSQAQEAAARTIRFVATMT